MEEGRGDALVPDLIYQGPVFLRRFLRADPPRVDNGTRVINARHAQPLSSVPREDDDDSGGR